MDTLIKENTVSTVVGQSDFLCIMQTRQPLECCNWFANRSASYSTKCLLALISPASVLMWGLQKILKIYS